MVDEHLDESATKVQDDEEEEDLGGGGVVAVMEEEPKSSMEAVDADEQKKQEEAYDATRNSALKYVMEQVDHQSSSEFSDSSSSIRDEMQEEEKKKELTIPSPDELAGRSNHHQNNTNNNTPGAVPINGGGSTPPPPQASDREIERGDNDDDDNVLLAAVPVDDDEEASDDDDDEEQQHMPPDATLHEEVPAVPVPDKEDDESSSWRGLIFRNRQVFCIVVVLVILLVSLVTGLLVSDRNNNNKSSDNSNNKEDPSGGDTLPPSVPPTSVESLYWNEVNSFDKLNGQPGKGYKLSMSGDGTVLVASPRTGGIARFFEKKESNGTTASSSFSWIENVNLRLNRTDNDSLGHDVSLSKDGKRVALGSNGYSALNFSGGKVEIYEMDDDNSTTTAAAAGTSWKTLQVIYGTNENDESGYSVALSKDGNTLAVGIPYRTYNSSTLFALGYVSVYRYWDDDIETTTTSSSSFQQVYGVYGEKYCDFAGGSVALSGDGSVLAIGAPSTCTDGVGNVRIFDYNEEAAADGADGNNNNNTWKQRGETIYEENNSTWFGFTIDLSDDGNYVAVGAVKGLYVKVFEWKEPKDGGHADNNNNNNNGEWKQIGQTLSGDEFDFGVVVSLSIQPPSSCNNVSSAILAINDVNSLYTYRMELPTLLSDDDNDNDNDPLLLWELIGVIDDTEKCNSLSTDGRTIGVVDRVNGPTVYEEMVETSTSSSCAGS
eukprot:scaffold1431_cov76-Cylindrotheca_fusiformis.AAC.2